MRRAHLAIDLGAGSGRGELGAIGPRGLELIETHRFTYAPRRPDGHLRWDVARLLDGVRTAVYNAAVVAQRDRLEVVSVGVDSWAVDYGLFDESDRLIEDPVCYRDERTSEALVAEVLARVPREELFARTGIQLLPLNTLFQLAAHAREGVPLTARRLLLIPDICHKALCGSVVTEATNASTTQLVGARTGTWDDELFDRLGLPRALMPDIVPAGTGLGRLHGEFRSLPGLGRAAVVAPATHDTASAVAGTPLRADAAYISSGTWSLVGVERTQPLLTPDVGEANFTNEGGVDGTVRFLKNVMGLWILESCRGEWAAQGRQQDYEELLTAAARVGSTPAFVFPDDPRFFNPSSMLAAIDRALRESGQPSPSDPVLVTRIVLDSLALRYASVVATIERLTGRAIPTIHIVGGGSRNAYLNQATANASGRPVLAGPVEATALGNVIVQARACGEVKTMEDARALVAKSFEPRAFEPNEPDAWADAAARYASLEARWGTGTA